MFYSSTPELGARKIAALNGQGDQSRWIVTPIERGVTLYSEILNDRTDTLGRIISAATGFAEFHSELELTDDAPADLIAYAESKLGEPYDWEGALCAWKNSGYNVGGKEFCSGFDYEILMIKLNGITKYPCPGRLLRDVIRLRNLPVPKFAVPAVEIVQADIDWLAGIRTSLLSTGTKQETLAALGAQA